jgi:hypothetical protein
MKKGHLLHASGTLNFSHQLHSEGKIQTIPDEAQNKLQQ